MLVHTYHRVCFADSNISGGQIKNLLVAATLEQIDANQKTLGKHAEQLAKNSQASLRAVNEVHQILAAREQSASESTYMVYI